MHLKMTWEKLTTYIFMIFIVLSCRSLIELLLGTRYIILFCSIAFMAGIIANSFYKKLNVKKNRRLILVAILYYCSILILFMFGDFLYDRFIAINIICVTEALLWFMIGDIEFNRKLALQCFTNIMFIIAAISLFFYLFGSILNVIQPTKIYPAKLVNWGTTVYRDFYHIYNDGQGTDNFGYSFLRNIGIFAEAPMYVYPLIIVLWLYFGLRLETLKPTGRG